MSKQEYQVPSSPADRSTIKKAIQEAADALLRIDAERELIRETAKDIKEKFGMPPSMFNQLARARFKDDITEKAEATEQLTDNYSILFDNNK